MDSEHGEALQYNGMIGLDAGNLFGVELADVDFSAWPDWDFGDNHGLWKFESED